MRLETTVSSRTKTAIIGPDRPFTVIGERINPTGRKTLAEEMVAGDFSRVEADALAQVQAGAHMLDVNAGIPLADEPALLAQAIQLVQSITDVPLCIDSSVVAALQRGLEVYEGKALVNSVTAEEERLETVLPLVKKHGAAVIGISNDETGISMNPLERFKAAKKIVERALDHGIPQEDVLIDPLAMPAGAVQGAARHVFEIVRLVREELGVNTVCGASNISFGLPQRGSLNAHFLSMAIAAGMPAAITNPCEKEIKRAILAADLLMGHDDNCAAWIAGNREASTTGLSTTTSFKVNDFYGYPIQAKERHVAGSGCGELAVAGHAASATKPGAAQESGAAAAERSAAAGALQGRSARPVPGPDVFFPCAWRMEASQA